MYCRFISFIALIFLTAGCDFGGTEAADEGHESGAPGSATFFANQGFVAETGEVIADGSGIKVDVVAYKHGTWLDLKGGREGVTYQALNAMNREMFSGLDAVPCTPPTDDQISAIFSTVEPGHGFTVRGNISTGIIKVFVKDLQASGSITVDYEFCE